MKLLLGLAAVLLLVLAPAACAPAATTSPATTGTTAAQTATASVSMANLAFSPTSLTVARGTTVVWTNNDATTHTVTSDTGLFGSGNIAPGGTFSYTFNSAGTYAYHCALHANMTGTVVVP